MKSLVLTMSLLAGTLMGYSQTKVIDYPKIGYRSSEALEFCQVEKSDTALILRGDVYNRPGYWVCVASSSVLKGNTTYWNRVGQAGNDGRKLDSFVLPSVRTR